MNDEPSRLAWPWAAAALCSVALAVPSVMALPARLAWDKATSPRPAVDAPALPATPARPATGSHDDDRLTTGSVVTTPHPAVEPTMRLFGIRLAGGESSDLLWSHWSEIRSRFPGLLEGLASTVRPTPSGEGSIRFELLAGRYRNAAEAAAVCGRLRAHDIACAVRPIEDAPAGARG